MHALPQRPWSWPWRARSAIASVPAERIPLPDQTPSPLPSPNRRLVSRCWASVDVSQRGAYSIERLFAYHAYCTQTSWRRVLAVCVLAPLPPLVVLLALECVTLAPPTAGWRANYVVFIRSFLCAVAIATCMVLQAKNIVPDLRLTRRETGVIACSTATAYTAMLLALASQWVFPIPFMVAVGSGPFVVFFSLSVVATVGLARFRAVTNLRTRFAAFLKLAAIQASMSVIYPSFQAFYVRQHRVATQIAAVCLLQLIKLVLKSLLDALVAGGIDDYKPEIVVFSVDVFHGLYVASCMQATPSPWTKVVIIGLDVAHQLLSLHAVRKRAHEIHRLVATKARDAAPHAATNLVTVVVELLRSPERLQPHRLTHVRVDSILDHRLPGDGAVVLERLRQTFVLVRPSTPAALLHVQARPTATSTPILPAAMSSPQPTRVTSSGDVTQLLDQSLRVLFSCEYLALAEYVECMVPLAFALYLAVMRTLPNAQFYPQLAALTPHDLTVAIATIVIYALLELATCGAFHVVVWRALGVSPLHQLAFVLEHQTEMVEGKLFAWVLIVLQFQLIHFGADFSFAFAWI